MDNPRHPRALLSIDEFRRAAGIGRSLAYKLAADPAQLRTVRLGRRVLVPVGEVQRLAAAMAGSDDAGDQ